MRLSIMIMALGVFFVTWLASVSSRHLSSEDVESHDIDQLTGHPRSKRGVSFTVSKGKPFKKEQPIQIVIMKPNFLTDLVMLKKGLLQKVVMTVVGLVGKLAGAITAKAMPKAPAKTMAMPMHMPQSKGGPDKSEKSEAMPVTTPIAIGQTLAQASNAAVEPFSSINMNTAATSQPFTSVNMNSAGQVVQPSSMTPGMVNAAENAARYAGLVSIENRANTLKPIINYNQRQVNPGAWAVASHSPQGGVFMIMPSGSSAHDPMAHAVLTMMLNNPNALYNNRVNYQIQPNPTKRPVVMYAQTEKSRHVPVFNTSYPSYASPKNYETNIINEIVRERSLSVAETTTVFENPTKIPTSTTTTTLPSVTSSSSTESTISSLGSSTPLKEETISSPPSMSSADPSAY